MSAGAKTATAGSPAAGAAGGGVAEPADAAGRLFGRLTVLPALLLMAWLLAGLPLLLLGLFTPVLMLVLSVPLAAVLVAVGLRWIPGRWRSPLPLRKPEHARTPWWAVVAVVAIAVAFGVDQMIYHSQQIIVMRDPASYLQFGNWIAHHGSLPIPQDRAAFSGSHHVLSFGSFAFYQVGGTVVPQFMAGVPMILPGGPRGGPSSPPSKCPASSPAGRPTASRSCRFSSSAGSALSSTRSTQTRSVPGSPRRSAASPWA